MAQQKTKEAGIYRLKDGRLRIRATAKCPKTGQMRETQRTLREGATLEDARQMREALKESLKAPADEKASAITTLADYSEQWIGRKSRKMKASTISKYVRVLGRMILPELGHLRMDRLTRRDVSEWIVWAENQQLADGRAYSRDTVASWWRVLRVLLKDAHAQGYLAEDLSYRQTPPDTGAGGRQEKRTLTAAQLGEFVEAARTFAPTRYAEIVTLAYTGMRPGELYGLEWRDIDLGKGELKIRRGVWRGKVASTKTGSPREVPLPSIIVDALKIHRAEQVRAQHPGLDAGIVFPAAHGGRRFATGLSKPMSLLAEHIGLGSRVTPQVLRRTFNTLMITGQVDRIVLRSIMGHSGESMTERYAGIGQATKRQAIAQVFGE